MSKQYFWGGDRSGAALHYHVAAFNVLFIGEKEWYVPEAQKFRFSCSMHWIQNCMLTTLAPAPPSVLPIFQACFQHWRLELP